MTAAYASISIMLLGLICIRTGRGPLAMLALSLLYARAFGLWLRTHLWRGIRQEWRYFEDCLEFTKRQR